MDPLACFGSGLSQSQRYVQTVLDSSDSRIVALHEVDAVEAIWVLTRSFSGTPKTPPEPSLHWALGHTDWDNPKRFDLFNFYMSWVFHLCLRHGCCFGIRDSRRKNKLLAVACTFPPGTVTDGDVDTLWRTFTTICRVGIPPDVRQPEVYGEEVTLRMQALGSRMHDMHREFAPGDHWYIYTLGVDPQFQGLGAGRAMVNFVSSLADQDQVPVYLEASGEKNKIFYTRLGFELKTPLFRVAVPDRPDITAFEQICVGGAFVRPATSTSSDMSILSESGAVSGGKVWVRYTTVQ